MKEGEEITTRRIPIHFKYGKQRKKAKGNTELVFKVHVRCVDLERARRPRAEGDLA